MWLSAHTAAGGAIGARVGRPVWVVAILGVLSHIALDLVPHWDYDVLAPVVLLATIDTLLAVGLLILMARRCGRAALACAVGGVFAAIPDIEEPFVHFGVIDRYLFVSHIPAFPHGEATAAIGIPLQIGVIALSLWAVWGLGQRARRWRPGRLR